MADDDDDGGTRKDNTHTHTTQQQTERVREDTGAPVGSTRSSDGDRLVPLHVYTQIEPRGGGTGGRKGPCAVAGRVPFLPPQTALVGEEDGRTSCRTLRGRHCEGNSYSHQLSRRADPIALFSNGWTFLVAPTNRLVS